MVVLFPLTYLRLPHRYPEELFNTKAPHPKRLEKQGKTFRFIEIKAVILKKVRRLAQPLRKDLKWAYEPPIENQRTDENPERTIVNASH
jgi:hypothetical protein